jgi:hypothetical protein
VGKKRVKTTLGILKIVMPNFMSIMLFEKPIERLPTTTHKNCACFYV